MDGLGGGEGRRRGEETAAATGAGADSCEACTAGKVCATTATDGTASTTCGTCTAAAAAWRLRWNRIRRCKKGVG